MPAWVRDESTWTKAKAAVREQYPGVEEGEERFYKLATAIYKKMGGTISKSMIDEAAPSLRAHKYVSRVPDGRGGWRYRYDHAAVQSETAHARMARIHAKLGEIHGSIAHAAEMRHIHDRVDEAQRGRLAAIRDAHAEARRRHEDASEKHERAGWMGGPRSRRSLPEYGDAAQEAHSASHRAFEQHHQFDDRGEVSAMEAATPHVRKSLGRVRLLLKAEQLALFGAPSPPRTGGRVKAHDRRTKTGKIVHVQEHASGRTASGGRPQHTSWTAPPKPAQAPAQAPDEEWAGQEAHYMEAERHGDAAREHLAAAQTINKRADRNDDDHAAATAHVEAAKLHEAARDAHGQAAKANDAETSARAREHGDKADAAGRAAAGWEDVTAGWRGHHARIALTGATHHEGHDVKVVPHPGGGGGYSVEHVHRGRREVQHLPTATLAEAHAHAVGVLRQKHGEAKEAASTTAASSAPRLPPVDPHAPNTPAGAHVLSPRHKEHAEAQAQHEKEVERLSALAKQAKGKKANALWEAADAHKRAAGHHKVAGENAVYHEHKSAKADEASAKARAASAAAEGGAAAPPKMVGPYGARGPQPQKAAPRVFASDPIGVQREAMRRAVTSHVEQGDSHGASARAARERGETALADKHHAAALAHEAAKQEATKATVGGQHDYLRAADAAKKASAAAAAHVEEPATQAPEKAKGEAPVYKPPAPGEQQKGGPVFDKATGRLANPHHVSTAQGQTFYGARRDRNEEHEKLADYHQRMGHAHDIAAIKNKARGREGVTAALRHRMASEAHYTAQTQHRTLARGGSGLHPGKWHALTMRAEAETDNAARATHESGAGGVHAEHPNKTPTDSAARTAHRAKVRHAVEADKLSAQRAATPAHPLSEATPKKQTPQEKRTHEVGLLTSQAEHHEQQAKMRRELAAAKGDSPTERAAAKAHEEIAAEHDRKAASARDQIASHRGEAEKEARGEPTDSEVSHHYYGQHNSPRGPHDVAVGDKLHVYDQPHTVVAVNEKTLRVRDERGNEERVGYGAANWHNREGVKELLRQGKKPGPPDRAKPVKPEETTPAAAASEEGAQAGAAERQTGVGREGKGKAKPWERTLAQFKSAYNWKRSKGWERGPRKDDAQLTAEHRGIVQEAIDAGEDVPAHIAQTHGLSGHASAARAARGLSPKVPKGGDAAAKWAAEHYQGANAPQAAGRELEHVGRALKREGRHDEAAAVERVRADHHNDLAAGHTALASGKPHTSRTGVTVHPPRATQQRSLAPWGPHGHDYETTVEQGGKSRTVGLGFHETPAGAVAHATNLLHHRHRFDDEKPATKSEQFEEALRERQALAGRRSAYL